MKLFALNLKRNYLFQVFVYVANKRQKFVLERFAAYYGVNIIRRGKTTGLYVVVSNTWLNLKRFLFFLHEFEVNKGGTMSTLIYRSLRPQGSLSLLKDEQKVLPKKSGPRYIKKKLLRKKFIEGQQDFMSRLQVRARQYATFFAFMTKKNIIQYAFFKKNFLQVRMPSLLIYFFFMFCLQRLTLLQISMFSNFCSKNLCYLLYFEKLS